jgi:FdhD protein
MSESVRRVAVTRVGRPGAGPGDDAAAVEEPLEVRVHGRPFAVIMRTPGADRELAAGFLFAEGVVASAADIGAVEHCRHPDHPDRHNVVDVYLMATAAAGAEARLAGRRTVTSSSCGICGRASIESLRTRAEPLPSTAAIDAALAARLPDLLRATQAAFDRTGGLHAAGLFAPDGRCVAAAEDVGRHNAVDKIVGRLLLDERLPARGLALAVSGRTSFEIVQKAWLAGVEIVCAVSAPSSLAIDLAEAAGITLLGFARGGGFNIYSRPHRIAGV